MSTIYADLVRLESILERAASGIGGLLERADGGPLSWPTVEARLLEVYEIIGEARMPLAVDRLEEDFRRAEILEFAINRGLLRDLLTNQCEADVLVDLLRASGISHETDCITIVVADGE